MGLHIVGPPDPERSNLEDRRLETGQVAAVRRVLPLLCDACRRSVGLIVNQGVDGRDWASVKDEGKDS